MFTGCGTAMVTPFRRDGSLDEATLRKLIERQIDAGVDFLVPCGTTGESPTLTQAEHLRVVEITVKVAARGGLGGIAVVSCEIPFEMARLTRLAARGDFVAARELHRRYLPLMEINFVESNPGPVKAAMAEMGLVEAVWRLPLVAPRAENLSRIRGVLASLDLVRERVHAAVGN